MNTAIANLAATKRVLVVEDDAATAELERRTLTRAGFVVSIAGSVRAALAVLQQESFQAILLDYQLPDGDSWTVVEAAEALTPRVPVILVTAMGNERVAAEAIHRGVAEYLKKADSFLEHLPTAVDRVARLAHAEAALRRTDALFQLIAHNTADVIMLTDIEGIVKYVSPACLTVYGVEPGELIGQSSLNWVHPDDCARLMALIAGLQPHQRVTTSFRARRLDGREVWVESNINALPDPASGQVTELVRVSRDVTARKQAEEAIREQEIRYRTIFADSPISLWEEDFSVARAYLDGLHAAGVTDLVAHLRAHPEVVAEVASRVQILTVNEATLRLYAAKSTEQLSTGLHQTFSEDSLTVFCEEICAFLSGATTFSAEARTRTLEGRDNIINIRVSLLPGCETSWKRAVVSMFDITAHRDIERRLRDSLREKEVLLKEIHHRVKNNLQVISSLMNLQMSHFKHAEARELLAECRSRIESIAMIHENLYQANDLAHVNFNDYVRTLVGNLFHSFDAATRGIDAIVDVGDVRLAVDTAIPCGLIINELVTNSLKHAFEGREIGCVYVGMRKLAENRMELSVRDDGCGIPAGVEVREIANLGLDLVYTFAEQLEAEVELTREVGTAFRFRFATSAY